MHEELQSLEVQNTGLQLLVSELLMTNQQLRSQIEQLRPATKTKAIAQATHPQLRPGH